MLDSRSPLIIGVPEARRSVAPQGRSAIVTRVAGKMGVPWPEDWPPMPERLSKPAMPPTRPCPAPFPRVGAGLRASPSTAAAGANRERDRITDPAGYSPWTSPGRLAPPVKRLGRPWRPHSEAVPSSRPLIGQDHGLEQAAPPEHPSKHRLEIVQRRLIAQKVPGVQIPAGD